MKTIGEIPVVISRGTPYEIGHSHGKAYPEKIQRSFAFNLQLSLDQGEITRKELYEIAQGFIKPVERYNKDYLEEIQGIADGCGMRLEDIMVLNCRTELQKLFCHKQPGEACTSIAFTVYRNQHGPT